MLTPIITAAIQMLAPKAPSWLAPLFAAIIPAAIEVVEELNDTDGLDGHQKFNLAAHAIGASLDEAFDYLPEWSDLGEAKRDTIVEGLVELAVFLSDVSDKEGGGKSTRRLLRRAKRFIAKG